MIREIKRAFESEDATTLRRIAIQLARSAAMENSKWLAQLSVISYSLSKILTKTHFRTSPNWPRYRSIILSALRDAEAGRERQIIERLERTIRRIDSEDGHFIKNMVDKARSKMASEAYSTGISLSSAAYLFDADLHDLSDYVGKLKIHDEHEPKIGIKDRVNALRRLLHADRK